MYLLNGRNSEKDLKPLLRKNESDIPFQQAQAVVT